MTDAFIVPYVVATPSILIRVYVFSPFPLSELMCAGEIPVSGPIPACIPDERVMPFKTLLWDPRLASVAIPSPSSLIVISVCIFVCLSMSNILMERTEIPSFL